MFKNYLKYLQEKFEQEVSPVLDIYGNGKDFEITDNQQLYEIVKMVKDILDKHFYAENFLYNMGVEYNKLIVKFMDEDEKKDAISIKNSMWTSYILDDIIGFIELEFNRKYPNKVKVKKEIIGEDDIRIVMLTVELIDPFPYRHELNDEDVE